MATRTEARMRDLGIFTIIIIKWTRQNKALALFISVVVRLSFIVRMRGRKYPLAWKAHQM